jgi:hypothetical protein
MPAHTLKIDLQRIGALESNGQFSRPSPRRHDQERALGSPAV